MKQGQQARGGRKRQEVAKTWRRKPVEHGTLGQFVLLPRAGKRCRGKNPTGGAGDPGCGFGRGRVVGRSSSGALCRRA
jgi:hypothetical protein